MESVGLVVVGSVLGCGCGFDWGVAVGVGVAFDSDSGFEAS